MDEFAGYRGLSDLEGLSLEVQLAALIGLVTTEGASMEDTIASIAAWLVPSAGSGEAGRQAYLKRRRMISRKQLAQKLEILELVWPHRWTPVRPLVDAVSRAAKHRNDLAHTYASIDTMAMFAKGGDPYELNRRDYWVRSTRSNGSVRVDLPAIDAVLRELSALNRRLGALFFLRHSGDIPLDVAWHLENEPGSFTRIDKPEAEPGFTGWAQPKR
ncbi:hypothetical protein [uncultured Microbacterium sp.]|uniref:hypothetical protein n=1 Tax=uncultured Microbacterium sp. TaxID=191216 RepID=UPI0028E7F4E4|nr:hypothetical protein [uncultured Microbacterium sp.]